MTTPSMAPVIRAATVACDPEHTFTLFAQGIGAWWPLATHSIFQADARTVSFTDGVLVEQSHDGKTCVWGEVLTWDPPHAIAFTWHPGRDDDRYTRVVVTFTRAGAGTRVDLEHGGWEVLGSAADEERRGYDDDGGWTEVFGSFVKYAEVEAPKQRATT